MIRQIEFDIIDPGKKVDWIGFYPIQANISNRLKEIDEIKYSKWQIQLIDGVAKESTFDWDEGRDMRIQLNVDFSKITGFKTVVEIEAVYNIIFESLKVIWRRK